MASPRTDPVRPCWRGRQVLNEAAGMGARDIAVFAQSRMAMRIETHRLRDCCRTPSARRPGCSGSVAQCAAAAPLLGQQVQIATIAPPTQPHDPRA